MTEIKSKRSRSKIRRWGFTVTATKDGQSNNFVPPALTIGNYTAAISAAKEIHSELVKMPQFEGATIKVTPDGFETISQVVLNQLREYEKLTNLLTNSLKMAAIEYLLSTTKPPITEEEQIVFDKLVTETVGRWVIAEREKTKKLESPVEEVPEIVDVPENPYGVVSNQETETSVS